MIDNITKKEVENYFYGRCSGEELSLVEQWFIDNVNSKKLDNILLDILESCPADNPVQAQKAFITFCEKNHITVRERKAIHWYRWAARVAAIIVLALLGYTTYQLHRRTMPREWVEAYAPSGKSIQITLPDSSKIRLNAGSKILYPKEFDSEIREVYVTGEAYAEIAKDARHPFYLLANEIKIKVLGTRFNVKSYSEDSEIEVALIEGSIKLESRVADKNDTTILVPGDIVKFDKVTGRKTAFTLTSDFYSQTHPEKNFYFLDKKLEDIARQLERSFKVRIVIENKELAEAKYYAIYVNNESVDQILNGINSSGLMDIRRQGENLIYISKRR